MIFSIAMRNKV